MSQLISTNWLYKNLRNKNIVILDCSWFLPSEHKNPELRFKKIHIGGSYFFNIEKISDLDNKFPHMIPNIDTFKKKVKNFNINKKSKIIVYGNENILGPSRVWWMFKYFGFENIYVLNGGLSKWVKEKKTTTNQISKKKSSTYRFSINDSWITSKKQIVQNLFNSKYLIFDARNNNRFKGIEEEPRKTLNLGHIPKSKNIFWKELTEKGEKIISKRKIKDKFKKYNLKNKNIIISCGSGISACVLSLSLMHALDMKSSVYDGSWAEWGSNNKLESEK